MNDEQWNEPAMLRLLVASVKDYAIFLLDPEGHVRTWNAGAEGIKGWRAEEIIGRHFSTFYSEADMAAGKPARELREAAADGRFEDEGWRLRRDGSRIWANVIITALRNPAGELVGFAKVTRDLSERRRSEELLAESENRLREAQTIARMGDWQWDVATDHVTWSDGLLRVYGLQPEDFTGTFDAFLSHVHPDDRANTRAQIENAYANRTAFELEERIIRPDGEVRTLHSRGTCVTDENGAVSRLVGICIDITERKEAEVRQAALIREQAAREEAEQQAEEFEQMMEELAISNEQLTVRTEEAEHARAEAERASRAKSQFLANMSHELRTPLNAIAGYTDLLDLEVHGPIVDAQRQALRRIQRNQRHLLSLINDLLNFSKLTAGRVSYALAAVPVAGLFEDLEGLIGLQVQRRGLVLRATPPPEPLAVQADTEKLVQVLLNLLTNAVKFTDPGGSVTLTARALDGRVTIEVADTGRGIPQDRLDAIFDPFVQVHSDETFGEGTGLGLAIARELARGMGGDLTVTSEPDVGSTFYVTLPVAPPVDRRRDPATRS